MKYINLYENFDFEEDFEEEEDNIDKVMDVYLKRSQDLIGRQVVIIKYPDEDFIGKKGIIESVDKLGCYPIGLKIDKFSNTFLVHLNEIEFYGN